MAKTKSKGTTKLGRDSISKRLGVKLYAGQRAQPGSIIIRQRGTKFLAGINVKRAKDDSLYAIKKGKIRFRTTYKYCFNGRKRKAKIVDVI